jgi:oxygen-independent coproporphyrinogen-3 oxidase
MMTAGIYVHLPYCASRCGYCAFVVSTDGSTRDAYLAALDVEAALAAPEAQASRFDSIYLGGGTPSLLPVDALAELLRGLRRRFTVEPAAEVTLEANPEDVTAEAARAWVDAGVSRVSVGVQSLSDAELAGVGRRHDASRARAALETLAGENVPLSGDLILGLPGQTPESFRESLAGLARAGVGHVSVYLLEADKSKSLEEDRRRNPGRYPADDVQADMWLELGETLAREGFVHYEISNWARPGQEARHNLKYWTREPTLGLGVAAHELWGGRRRANVSSLEAYVGRLREGARPIALDRPIDAAEAAREEVFLGLRLSRGVEEGKVEAQVAGSRDPRLPGDYADWIEAGLLSREAGRVRFTERGFLISNEVLSRFV